MRRSSELAGRGLPRRRHPLQARAGTTASLEAAGRRTAAGARGVDGCGMLRPAHAPLAGARARVRAARRAATSAPAGRASPRQRAHPAPRRLPGRDRHRALAATAIAKIGAEGRDRHPRCKDGRGVAQGRRRALRPHGPHRAERHGALLGAGQRLALAALGGPEVRELGDDVVGRADVAAPPRPIDARSSSVASER